MTCIVVLHPLPLSPAAFIAETGDHPLSGRFCPGLHRAPWTPARVRTDAMTGLRQSSAPPAKGRHRTRVTRLLTLAELLAADELVDALWLTSISGCEVRERVPLG